MTLLRVIINAASRSGIAKNQGKEMILRKQNHLTPSCKDSCRVVLAKLERAGPMYTFSAHLWQEVSARNFYSAVAN